MKIFKSLLVIIVIAGLALIAIGFAIGASFTSVFAGLSSNDDYTLEDTETYSETLSDIVLDLETRNVEITSTTDDFISIDYYSKEDDTWLFDFNRGVLEITQDEPSGIFNWFSWTLPTSNYLDVIITIPEAYSFDVDVKTNTGDISLENFDALGDISLVTDTGSVSVELIDAVSLYLESDTGSLKVKDVNADEDITLDTSTGSADIENTTCESLSVDLSTGSIDIDDVVANKIDLDTNTGSIDVEGINLTNRTLRLSTDTGSVKVNGNDQGDTYNLILTDEDFYLTADTNTGSIRIKD
ncbi:DUF4097 domain-containing protein [Mycoplasmatota bacterium]|nr:DUF4097 domain-containing protein [Mycoplasmatota bacterium]